MHPSNVKTNILKMVKGDKKMQEWKSSYQNYNGTFLTPPESILDVMAKLGVANYS